MGIHPFEHTAQGALCIVKSGAHRANQGQGHKEPAATAGTDAAEIGAKGPGAPLKQRAETCRSSRAQRDKRADGGARELKPLPTCSASPGSGASIVSALTIQAVQVFSLKASAAAPGCRQSSPTGVTLRRSLFQPRFQRITWQRPT